MAKENIKTGAMSARDLGLLLRDFKDPMLGMMYSAGMPVMDQNYFGDRNWHTMGEDMPPPVAPETPGEGDGTTDGNEAAKLNPMGKFDLPKWYWQWMRSQGIAGQAPTQPPNRQSTRAAAMMTPVKGLLD